MKIDTLGPAQLRRAAEIKDELVDLQNELNQLLGEAIVAAPMAKKRRTMSAAGRKRVAAAQKARWAKIRAAKK